MPSCNVPGCENYKITRSIGVPFHRFPSDARRRREWLVKIRNKNLPINSSFKKVKNLRVCGKHFVPSDYVRDLQHELTGSKRKSILKKDAVPSIFPFLLEIQQNDRSAFAKREMMRVQSVSRVTPLPFAFGSSKQQSECSTSSVSHSQTVPSISTELECSSPFKINATQSPLFTPGINSETDFNTTDSETEFYGEGGMNDNDCVLVSKKNLAELFKTCQICGQGIISKRTMHVGAKLVINWECIQGVVKTGSNFVRNT
ncbi:hypothetical protein SNE40_014279 [Patella caerulea]|uniref:THAP-type domain-containing protein n=1 Tax=Patella caerulea TaxID=87958 RepID=A0AAN8PIV3_PATCE